MSNKMNKQPFNLLRRTISTTFIDYKLSKDLDKFAKHNLQFADRMELIIYNPKTVSKDSIFRTHVFNATIYFKKNDMTMFKKFEENDFNVLTVSINNFIKNEITL